MKTIEQFKLSLREVVDGAVGPFEPYCMGYLNPGASGFGYIATMKLSTGTVSMKGLDPGTEGIVSYDRCEKNDAYIGQINMLTASSFCGVNGALWGYHLAKADEIATGKLKPLYKQKEGDQEVPVFPVKPLLDAAERLFGKQKQRRFPPMPGAHVVCANKNATNKGPGWIWASIAIAIADKPDSESNLFIEDVGFFKGDEPEPEIKHKLEGTERAVTKSIVMCGVDQDVRYKEMFVGYKYERVEKDSVGCALACAPYVVLAQDAVPPGKKASSIIDMTITDWEKAVGVPPLPAGA